MVKKQDTKTIQGGYSDIRLWPCYIVISGLMLFLMPLVGFLLSLIAVGTPAVLISIWVAQTVKIVSREEYQAQIELMLAEKARQAAEKEVVQPRAFPKLASPQNI